MLCNIPRQVVTVADKISQMVRHVVLFPSCNILGVDKQKRSAFIKKIVPSGIGRSLKNSGALQADLNPAVPG